MDIKRKVIYTIYYEGLEDGWETVHKINRTDKPYLKNLVKKYCGKNLFGKTFRLAYVEINNERYWIEKVSN